MMMSRSVRDRISRSCAAFCGGVSRDPGDAQLLSGLLRLTMVGANPRPAICSSCTNPTRETVWMLVVGANASEKARLTSWSVDGSKRGMLFPELLTPRLRLQLAALLPVQLPAKLVRLAMLYTASGLARPAARETVVMYDVLMLLLLVVVSSRANRLARPAVRGMVAVRRRAVESTETLGPRGTWCH